MKTLKRYFSELYMAYCREFKLVLHDGGLILFITFLPLIYPIIYSLIYNPEVVREVAMVVVDNDRTPLSRELVRKLDATEQIWVRGYAANLSEARHAMDSRKCFSILEIPEGFARKIGRSEKGNAVMYADVSLLLRYKASLVATTNIMEEMGAELMHEDINRVAPLAGTITDGNIMPINSISLGNIKSGFDSFIMPGVLVLIIHQCIILAVGMAGGARRERMALNPRICTPFTGSVAIAMLGKILCYTTLLVLPAFYMIHYVPLLFKFPVVGSLAQEFIFLMPMMLACFGIGFVFQATVREREEVFLSWVITSVFFLLISGIVWPRYDMPQVWKAISSILPSTWAVEGYIKMATNGSTLAQVRTEFINLWLCAAGWLVTAYLVQRLYIRKLNSDLLKRKAGEDSGN